MRDLIIRGKLIKADPMQIIQDLQTSLSNGKLAGYKITSGNIAVPCPHHANGKEKHYSCYINLDNDDVPYLWYSCFTCGSKGSIAKFIGECFDASESFGFKWLLDHYPSYDAEEQPELFIKKIELEEPEIKTYLDDSVLDKFVNYHPYMTKRKLTRDVITKFDIKYDPNTKCIVFPVRDTNGKISYLTRRSVEEKKFIIDKGADKKVIYLLDNVLKENYDTVFVVESQLNALTLEGWGYHAIALMGAGTTDDQMNALNSTGIKHYYLCYDPDDAGRKGAKRFCKRIRKDVFVDIVELPKGKDVNDLNKEEFEIYLQNASWVNI